VRFLDSWVWLEFLFDGEAADDAEAAIERANTPEVGGLVAPTVVADVSYRLRVVDGAEPAEEAVRAIRDYEHVESLPLVDEVADYAAELRHDYYESDKRELSYADAIHLATAVVHDDCGVLYTGDPDFEGVDEIETVVL
jgi:predicted nucleic acid-binding protein